MDINSFKSTVARVLEPKFSITNYKMNFTPPGYDGEGNIWFEKILREGIYIVIDFQPSFLRPNYTVDFTVNLARNASLYNYEDRQFLPGYFLNDRLASWLWIENRNHPEWKSEYWWHFQNVAELEDACQDVFDKLSAYGVPFLENLNSKSLRFQ